MLSKHFIVQLEFQVWLAPWEGDPGRTTRIEHAQKFDSQAKAERALANARKFRPFERGFVDTLRATVV